MTERIQHFATGGTIDSLWNPSEDTATPRTQSIIPTYTDESIGLERFQSETLFMKDSRDISIPDQELIAAKTAETNAKKVLVTTGTFLMPDFGRTIEAHPMKKQFQSLGKKIVLTGSLKPMEGFLRSDGGFNIGMSCAVLEESTAGSINICMNGSAFPTNTVRKDLTQAEFDGQSKADDIIPFSHFDLITIGGSIDFQFDDSDGLTASEKSSVPDYLRQDVRLKKSFHAINPFIKDSRDISPEDLSNIGDIVEQSNSEHIMITAGIYKIAKIRDYLLRNEKNKNKVIILTGSKRPLALGDNTDATFNLGYSLGKMGFMEPGIYICLNGKIFETETQQAINKIIKP